MFNTFGSNLIMGLFNILKGKSSEPMKATKFIDFRIIALFGDKMKKKEVEETASSMLNILINTHALFSKSTNALFEQKHFIGCVNPTLNINMIMGYGEPKFQSNLSKEFTYFVEKEKGLWKISLMPMIENKVDLYSLPMLYNDLFILAQANIWIKEAFKIKVNLKDGFVSTFDVDIIDGEPVLIYKEPLFNEAYRVIDRINAAKEFPDLEKFTLGEPINEALNNILKNIDSGVGGKKEKQWAKLVKRIMKENNLLK